MGKAAFFSAYISQSTDKSHVTQGGILHAIAVDNNIPFSDFPQVVKKATADYRQKRIGES